MNIIESFDNDSSAVINPGFRDGPVLGFPETAVCCFMQSTIDVLFPEICDVPQKPDLRLPVSGAPVRIINYESRGLWKSQPGCSGEQDGTDGSAESVPGSKRAPGRRTAFALCRLPVGAPSAAAALENLYAAGVRTAVVFGTCGVLKADIGDCSVIIPDSALRCEGTSFHYVPASDEIVLNGSYKEEFAQILNSLSVPYRTGKVWTTDAVYRETRNMIEKRRRQGCICVDMECSALAAVATFRRRGFFQFFCAADNLDAPAWERRSLGTFDLHERRVSIVRSALELASLISDEEK
ncbi:MAG: nucleoside phosphorylase [Anaerovoracaceae bacterium]|jgi:uridine phosphorylase